LLYSALLVDRRTHVCTVNALSAPSVSNDVGTLLSTSPALVNPVCCVAVWKPVAVAVNVTGPNVPLRVPCIHSSIVDVPLATVTDPSPSVVALADSNTRLGSLLVTVMFTPPCVLLLNCIRSRPCNPAPTSNSGVNCENELLNVIVGAVTVTVTGAAFVNPGAV